MCACQIMNIGRPTYDLSLEVSVYDTTCMTMSHCGRVYRVVTVLLVQGLGPLWLGKTIDVLGQFGKFYSQTMILKKPVKHDIVICIDRSKVKTKTTEFN